MIKILPEFIVNRDCDYMSGTLKRSRTDRMIGGVCGGIGKHLGIDPTLIRLLWAAAIFIYGTGLLLYILAWIIIPEE